MTARRFRRGCSAGRMTFYNTLQVTVATVVLSACNGPPTVRIENTSVQGQWILLQSDSGDTFFNDTIAAGEIRCWAAPDIAWRQNLWLVVNELRDHPGTKIEPFVADSLKLNGGWTLRIRNSRFEPGSSEWQARWDTLHQHISRWNIGAREIARRLGEAPPSRDGEREYERMMKSVAESWAGAPRYIPNVRLTPGERCSRDRP